MYYFGILMLYKKEVSKYAYVYSCIARLNKLFIEYRCTASTINNYYCLLVIKKDLIQERSEFSHLDWLPHWQLKTKWRSDTLRALRGGGAGGFFHKTSALLSLMTTYRISQYI
jgi:hypothetical protein